MASPEELPQDDVVADILNDAGEVDDAKVADALGVSQDDDQFKTLKYSLLGQSLTKAGQDSVDQTKVCPVLERACRMRPHNNLRSRKSYIMRRKVPNSSTARKSVIKS